MDKKLSSKQMSKSSYLQANRKNHVQKIIASSVGVTVATILFSIPVSAEEMTEMVSMKQVANKAAVTSSAPMTIAYELDGISLTATIDSEGKVISGRTDPGSVIRVIGINNEFLGSTIANTNGDYTFTLMTPLTNGEELTVSTENQTGNRTQKKITAPMVPVLTATINQAGTVISGRTDPGSIIRVIGVNNEFLGATIADTNGDYNFILITPLTNGEELTVSTENQAGNRTQKKITAPTLQVLTATINQAGTIINGRTNPGSVIRVIGINNEDLGSTTADANGDYAITLTTPQTNGEELTIATEDQAGNRTQKKITAPMVPVLTATINQAGTIISGRTDPGSVIRIIGKNNEFLGSTIANTNGNYIFTLMTPLTNGEELTVSTENQAGNRTQKKITAPALQVLTATINQAGTIISGRTNPGSVVYVKGKNNKDLGTVTADANGDYAITLTTPQTNGEELTIAAEDQAGNKSLEKVIAPTIVVTVPIDTTPPTLTATIDKAGTVVSGKTEAGLVVYVKGKNNKDLGTVTADANGDYAITLTTPQTNGEELIIATEDQAGNKSQEKVIAPIGEDNTLDSDVNTGANTGANDRHENSDSNNSSTAVSNENKEKQNNSTNLDDSSENDVAETQVKKATQASATNTSDEKTKWTNTSVTLPQTGDDSAATAGVGFGAALLGLATFMTAKGRRKIKH